MANMDRYGQKRELRSEAPLPQRWFSEGLGVGILGGAGVALWFLILDTITRAPFYTPAALGSVLFFGAQGPADVVKNFTTVGGYTIVHFAVFMALGVFFVWMVDKVQSRPRRWLIALMSFILLDGLFAGTVMMVGEWVIRSIGVWAIAVGNIVAIAIMAAMVWATHPLLRHELLEKPVQPAV